ncbi:MAG: 3-hydroxyacyl-ACP dehydratase FabZ family protein [Planctomycetota bacterium]
MAPRSLLPLDSFDPSATVAALDEIRKANPQRFEMEQLSRICHVDVEAGEVAGVLEIPAEPFWARGHIPGRPLMPGVLMIEAAAQLCSYLVRQIYDPAVYGERFFGFGGLDDVKFRGMVLPEQDLVLLGRQAELRPRRAVFDTQGLVDGKMTFQARITGMWV